MYVANIYVSMVKEVNRRLLSLDGMHDKTIGLSLEAAGGLYRKLAKKFPIKGPCTFKRRELTTSVVTRTRFPELVVRTPEKMRFRVRVVIGLDIIEKPIVERIDDAEWFNRLTGRSDVVVFPHDYKFNAPRYKKRRAEWNPISGYFKSRLEAPPTAKFCDVCGS